MQTTAHEIVIVSPRSLVRELLAALLHARGIPRVTGCASPAEGLALAPSARAIVCDAAGMPPPGFDAFRESARNLNAQLHVLRLDESSGPAGIDAVVSALHPAALGAPLPHETLTPLESEVMLGVAAGLRNSDIALRMRRSAKTVEKHRANALRKLGVRSVAQLTAYALRHRLLDGESLLARPGD